MQTDTLNPNSQVQLAFDRVSFDFDGAPALREVSFELRRGETLVVLGAAGSGKTVLLKLALGLLKPASGRVILFGEDTSALSEREWYKVRSHVGVLFQEGGLFDSLDIEDNVAYPLRNQPELRVSEDEVLPRVVQSLEFVELGGTLEKYPSELSGGMRRRAGIARAIVTQPELLLYDSPTAGLDPITANTIVALITKGRDMRGATTVFVTQRSQDGQILAGCRYDAAAGELRRIGAGEAPPATQYLVLKEGAVVFSGTPAGLAGCNDSYVAKFAPAPFLAS
jgi:phospholipid/cholesterol/gamma-HCH transport system ATP-binding protein